MAPDQRDGTATTLRPGRVTPDEVWIRNLLDSSDEVIYFKDLLSRFVRVSHGCAALHGRTQEELYGLTDTDLFASEHAVKARVDEEEVIRTGRPILNMAERETWAGRPDTWVASSKFPLRDLDGTVIGTFGISRDITPRVLAEQETACMTQAMAVAYGELRRVESELRAVLNGTTDAIAQYDGDLRLRYLNPAAERLSGRCLADLVGLTDAEAGTDWTDLQEPALRRVLETGTPDEVEFELRAPGGETLWFHTTFSADRDADGAVVGVLASTRDVTANKRAEQALAAQALRDPVTGLANRYLLMDRLGRSLLRLSRAPGQVALFFIDVDHFKAVNDTYGHDVGDRVLRELGRRLSQVARQEDTVARLGGDEFVLLCDGVPTRAQVREIAARVVAALVAPVVMGDITVRVSASVGAAVADDAGTTGSGLLQQADLAMYRVKQSGRNDFHIFDPDTTHETDDRILLETDLKRALSAAELRLVYQPLLSLADQRLLGFEALLRWDHPTRGTLSPLDFLPAAERAGLMAPIGAWVLATACGRLATWSARLGPDAEPLGMSVNVAGSQLRAPGFTEQVAATVAAHGLAPSRLRLEVSERALTSGHPQVAAALAELATLGVQLAVDDFGATVSSLARLPHIPVSVVKLEHFTDLPRERGLVAAVIAAAHGLGMSVVGGGIEDAGQLAELSELACDDGQGFLLGRPLDDAGVEKLLISASTGSARGGRLGQR